MLRRERVHGIRCKRQLYSLRARAPYRCRLEKWQGYMSWGAHSTLTNYYAIDGAVSWGLKSSWWLICTVESYNALA